MSTPTSAEATSGPFASPAEKRRAIAGSGCTWTRSARSASTRVGGCTRLRSTGRCTDWRRSKGQLAALSARASNRTFFRKGFQVLLLVSSLSRMGHDLVHDVAFLVDHERRARRDASLLDVCAVVLGHGALGMKI